MNKCNHYLGYHHDAYDGFLPCFMNQLPLFEWIIKDGYRFNYCPTCGAKIDWKSVKSQIESPEDDGA